MLRVPLPALLVPHGRGLAWAHIGVVDLHPPHRRLPPVRRPTELRRSHRRLGASSLHRRRDNQATPRSNPDDAPPLPVPDTCTGGLQLRHVPEASGGWYDEPRLEPPRDVAPHTPRIHVARAPRKH